MDEYQDRHFKVPGMNEIKTVQMTVSTSAVLVLRGVSHISQLLSNRIDDLKGMQQVSKIYVRIQQSRNDFPSHLLRAGIAPPFPLFKAMPKPEVILKITKDEFETAGVRKATVHLVQEEKQERDSLTKVHGVRQWLDI